MRGLIGAPDGAGSQRLWVLIVLLPLIHPPANFTGLKYIAGILIRDTAIKDLINRIKRERNTEAVMSVQAGDNGFNRAVINIKGVHILSGIHLQIKMHSIM